MSNKKITQILVLLNRPSDNELADLARQLAKQMGVIVLQAGLMTQAKALIAEATNMIAVIARPFIYKDTKKQYGHASEVFHAARNAFADLPILVLADQSDVVKAQSHAAFPVNVDFINPLAPDRAILMNFRSIISGKA